MPVFLAPVVLGALRIGVGVAARQIAKNQVKRAAAVAAKGAAKSAKAAKPGTSKITKTASGYAIGNAASKVLTKKALGRAATVATVGTVVIPPLIDKISKTDTKSTSNEVPVGSRPFGGNSVIKDKTKAETAKDGDTTPSPQPEADPSEYKWNLPPHKWSMPLTPTLVNNPGGGYNDFGKPNRSSEAYRRGRLWWNSSANLDITVGSSNSSSDAQKIAKQASDNERKYGFQFLWNPESFSTAVQVQMETTPDVKDMFLSLVAAFPATETVAFNIVLDRTNDFACANAKFERPGLNTSNIFGVPAAQVSQYRPDQSYDNKVTERGLLRNSVREFSEYYSGNTSFQTSAEQLEEKLIDLFERGTIADVEYLYRAINGPGTGDTLWTNRRGIQTADIGFLMPTLLNIDIGPLAYKGYVTSLGVQHMRFTPDMIPISTNVSIQLNVLATAGLTSKKG
jgi:hypothetical protein